MQHDHLRKPHRSGRTLQLNIYFASSRISTADYHQEHKKSLINTRSNLLSERIPHAETNILPISKPFSDRGKSFIATIYENWHAIDDDTTLSII